MTGLRENQSGLTIVELSIAITITAVLMSIVVAFSIDKLRDSDLGVIKYQQLTTAQTGVDEITNDIRIASGADNQNRYLDPYSPGAPSNQQSWTSDSTHLVLAVAAADSSRNILWQDAHDYVSYKNNVIYFWDQTNHDIYRRVLADVITGNAAKTTCPAAHASAACPADHLVMENVSAFSIQYYDSVNDTVTPASARSVKINVQLLSNKYGQPVTTSYAARMVFRNG